MTASVPLCGCSADSCGDPLTPACERPGPGTVRTRCGPSRRACPAEPVPGRTPKMVQEDTAGCQRLVTPPDPHVELQGWRKHTAHLPAEKTSEVLQGTQAGSGTHQPDLGKLILQLRLDILECLCRGRVKRRSEPGGLSGWACPGRVAAGFGASG